jgi:hypothetical protein
MQWNEIPEGLANAWTEVTAPRAPRILNTAFNETGFYKAKQEPLASVLTDMPVTRHFKEYLENNKERVTETLRAPFEGTPRAPRRKFV